MSGHITKFVADGETCVVWTIHDFMKIQDVRITSGVFTHDGCDFILLIFPKGDTWFEGLTPPVLSMSLRRKYDNFKNYSNIEYVMGIRKADSSEFRNEKYISVLNADVRSTPAHELISRYNMELNKNDMLHEGTLTVFCNMRNAKEKPAVSVASSTPSTYDGVSTLIEKLKDVYLRKRYTDVKIIVESKEFLAHKVILCAQSEVFAAMFEHDTAEKRSGVLTIADSDSESFECFLLYLYTGKLDSVTSANAVGLYKTADKYGLKELKKECVEYMIKEISVDSFCNIFHLAIMHNESDLLSSATNFFIRNANAILTSKKWLTLLEEHASLCNELLVKFATSGIQK